ncbi:hypothetical protein ONS95_005809 [Cadophora gregata]|uniref:uncharacterized protein n=1 Tax=Cadophora gregata TaxID=51156 RepID=UPI0026DAD456|nr:uncharacterized protein ONS95_005809 [Cadophora gregata]KAK0103810.1 hypothetical protein ONS95_005809 [Cadophora gregata]
MTEYCLGALEHVGHHSESRSPCLSEYMEVRRRGVGVTPVIALMEYALQLEIPDHVYQQECFGKLKQVVIDVILIQNDIISYKKEQADGVPHNLITVLRNGGMTTQEAFNHAGEMLNKCYQEWLDVKAEFPAGEDLAKFVEGTRTIMLASLHWHFRSDRYFGEMKDIVRQHKIVCLEQESRMVVPSGLKLVVSAFQDWMNTFKKHVEVLTSYMQSGQVPKS